ncbi:MAG TPA: oligosaccharide flippase family protein [Micropepsaceae bacterium]|nr:oligosaccharide flippase family protein [Micropepsaceae bacterium]
MIATDVLFRFASSIRGRKRLSAVALYGIVGLLPKVSSATLAIFYTRRFEAGEYGNYGIFASIMYLLATALDFGVASAALRNFSSDKNRSLAYLSQVIHAARLLTYFALPVFGAALYLLWGQLGVRFTQAWLFVPALLLIAYFGRTADMLATICRAIERPGYFAAGQITQTAVSIVFGIGFVFFLRLGIGGALLAMMCAQGTALLTYQIILAPLFTGVRTHFDSTIMREALTFGLPLVPDKIASWIRLLALRPVLAHLLPLSSVGLYSFASSLAVIPNLLATPVDFALAPVYFRRRESSESDDFHRKMLDFGTIYAASMLPVWAFAILFCPEIIRLVAGQRYVGAAPICSILLSASFVRFQVPFLLRQIQFLRKTWIQSAITITWSAAGIGLTIATAGRYGVLSAAWSSLATELGILLSTAWAIRRHERVGYPIFVGLLLTGCLVALSVWTFSTNARVDWSAEILKFVVAILAAVASLTVWVWPRRRLVLQLAKG